MSDANAMIAALRQYSWFRHGTDSNTEEDDAELLADVQAVLDRAVADEREACAKIADDERLLCAASDDKPGAGSARAVAIAIRARGGKP